MLPDYLPRADDCEGRVRVGVSQERLQFVARAVGFRPDSALSAGAFGNLFRRPLRLLFGLGELLAECKPAGWTVPFNDILQQGADWSTEEESNAEQEDWP
jgi:hypothetical protein